MNTMERMARKGLKLQSKKPQEKKIFTIKNSVEMSHGYDCRGKLVDSWPVMYKIEIAIQPRGMSPEEFAKIAQKIEKILAKE